MFRSNVHMAVRRKYASIMGKKCILKNCKCSYDNSVGLTFHKFPINDNCKYERWVRSIPERLIDLPLHEYTYICSKHFHNDSYQPVTPTLKNLLRKNAVPSIFYVEPEENVGKENMTKENAENAIKENIVEEVEKIYVDVSTQISPKRIGVSKKEERLQKEVYNMQSRLHRRDETMRKLHNVLELMLEARQKFKPQCNDNSIPKSYG